MTSENTSPILELLPAVDVAGGRAVQLVQGVAGTGGEFGDPLQAALAWQEAGARWLHLVDLGPKKFTWANDPLPDAMTPPTSWPAVSGALHIPAFRV